MATNPIHQPDLWLSRLLAPRQARAKVGARDRLLVRHMFLLVGGYAYAVSVAATTFVLADARRNAGLEVDALWLILWQATVYGLWIPIGGLLWASFGKNGVSPRSLFLVLGLGVLLVPAHALLGALLDRVFEPDFRSLALASTVPLRLPCDFFAYTVVAALAATAATFRQNDSLAAALAAAKERHRTLATHPSAEDRRLLVSVGKRQFPVEAAAVEWFGAAGNYVVVNWNGTEGLIRDTLQRLEQGLDPALFARSHRSTIVNLAKVASAASLADGSWRLTMESGAELIASRTYRDRILERLGRR